MRHLTDGPKQDKFYEIEPQDIVIFITQKKKRSNTSNFLWFSLIVDSSRILRLIACAVRDHVQIR